MTWLFVVFALYLFLLFLDGFLEGLQEPRRDTAADAYRDALRAASRISQAAHEAERAMYAEAARHAPDVVEGSAIEESFPRRLER